MYPKITKHKRAIENPIGLLFHSLLMLGYCLYYAAHTDSLALLITS